MTYALLIIHLFVTLALIGVVLIQRSEGGGLGIGTSQGMGSFMSGRGTANLLTRTTAILGTIFFLLSLALALLNRGTTGVGRSILDTPAASAPAAPVIPGPLPTVPGMTQVPTTPAPSPAPAAAEPTAAAPAAPAETPKPAESPAAAAPVVPPAEAPPAATAPVAPPAEAPKPAEPPAAESPHTEAPAAATPSAPPPATQAPATLTPATPAPSGG
jgi:preprotein translocase subunit SecG